jgi:hypothetical protein
MLYEEQRLGHMFRSMFCIMSICNLAIGVEQVACRLGDVYGRH